MQRKNVLHTGFSVTPVRKADFYGFTLDGDGRYLLPDFTVTHNTTLSRIIASTLNGGTDPESDPDIREENLSDKRNIDNIREFARSMRFMPQKNNFRILIGDECHALTGVSASAVLKEIEEPAATSIWILCTNLPERLKPELLGRCNKLVLRKPTAKQLSQALLGICAAEKVKMKPKQCTQIAEMVGKQPREAVQLLQSAATYMKSGKDFNEAWSTALRTGADADEEKVAAKLLACIYTGKLEAFINTCYDAQEVGEVFSILGRMTRINNGILDKLVDRKPYWSYGVGLLWGMAEEGKLKLKTERVIETQARVLDARNDILTVAQVSAFDILVTRLAPLPKK